MSISDARKPLKFCGRKMSGISGYDFWIWKYEDLSNLELLHQNIQQIEEVSVQTAKKQTVLYVNKNSVH